MVVSGRTSGAARWRGHLRDGLDDEDDREGRRDLEVGVLPVLVRAHLGAGGAFMMTPPRVFCMYTKKHECIVQRGGALPVLARAHVIGVDVLTF